MTHIGKKRKELECEISLAVGADNQYMLFINTYLTGNNLYSISKDTACRIAEKYKLEIDKIPF